MVGAGLGVCPERQPVGLNLQGHGRRDGRGNEGDKRATGDGDETRMSALDACLLDLAVQGLGLPLVTTPCQGGVATEATG